MKFKNERISKIVVMLLAVVALVLIISIASKAADTISGISSGGAFGSTSTCSHVDTKTNITQVTMQRHKSETVCNSCGEVVRSVLSNHVWRVGVTSSCTVCNQECTHAYTVKTYVSNGDGTHRELGRCEYCGHNKVLNSSIVCTLSNGSCVSCSYGCSHLDTSVIDSVRMCNDCGNAVQAVTVQFGFGNAEGQTVYFIPGQTWAEALSSPRTIGGMYTLAVENVGPGVFKVKLTNNIDGSRSASLFLDGGMVNSSDIVVANRTYLPGINKVFNALIIGEHDDTTAPRYGYEQGWTWADICAKDFLYWGEIFTLTTDGKVVYTATGKVITHNGMPVGTADLIDGSLVYLAK